MQPNSVPVGHEVPPEQRNCLPNSKQVYNHRSAIKCKTFNNIQPYEITKENLRELPDTPLQDHWEGTAIEEFCQSTYLHNQQLDSPMGIPKRIMNTKTIRNTDLQTPKTFSINQK